MSVSEIRVKRIRVNQGLGVGQIYGGDFAKFCGLLRIYEL